ncbi:MAG: DUF86 domain-containing protein [Bacteroidales bacterium]|jgi:uncharacterized protein with HEPN domain|nr:DUF86 domain-containing protein [Bacteroidales bacterium]
MDKNVKVYLYDILDSINEIEEFILGNRTYEYYSNNKILQRAIERNLEIIGEAMNRILKLNNDFPIQNAKDVINTRNKIIHGYEQVDHTIIWSIVINHLPLLKTEVEKLLNENNTQK